jgi:hypothetical protein
MLKRLQNGWRSYCGAADAGGGRDAEVSFRQRVVAGLALGAIITFVLLCLRAGPMDFRWAISEANLVLHGQDPYSNAVGDDHVPYPLTAAFFGLPFILLKPAVAGALFGGISSGLLAFSISKDGPHRLLVFLCYPFWSAIVNCQWSPLLMAAALLPWLFPAVIAKPNLGIAVVLRSGRRAGLIAAAIMVAITLAILPTWPITWWRQIAGYKSFFPVATGLGMLLLFLLPFARKHKDARFLLSMAVVPQRWFYDALLLWLVPETAAEFLIAGVVSWGGFLLSPPAASRTFHQVAVLSVSFNYLPMLAVVLVRRAARWNKFALPAGGPGLERVSDFSNG